MAQTTSKELGQPGWPPDLAMHLQGIVDGWKGAQRGQPIAWENEVFYEMEAARDPAPIPWLGRRKIAFTYH